MSRIDPHQHLIPSILDRLIDEEPGNRHESPKQRNQVLRELKQSVQRDLQNLLNTRWRCVAWPPNLDELDQSLVNYGIPDFTGRRYATAGDREELRRVLEGVIKKFEPRFAKVKVHIQPAIDDIDRTVRFRIDAMLKAEPAPEPVVFDTTLETSTGDIEIKGANR